MAVGRRVFVPHGEVAHGDGTRAFEIPATLARGVKDAVFAMPSPQQIAASRFERITPFIDRSFNRAERRAAMRKLTRIGAARPSDFEEAATPRPISRATIARWIRAFRKGGMKGLEPKPRTRTARPAREDAEAWTLYAIRLLCEQPDRSLTQLAAYLALEFPGYDLSRATLHRLLLRHAAFPAVRARRRRRRRGGLRGSYEASRPHECWQLDGKGPNKATLADGSSLRFHVLTVLDDFSRAALAAVIAPGEDTRSAIKVVRIAIERYGLPDRMQFDRGSAFDSLDFRRGLANLGIHRNAVRPRHPEAQGKIEAYHRSLGRWFLDELPAQEVKDSVHLQQLLDATLAVLYNRHFHREIKGSPEARLAGRVSERRVAAADLLRAFFADAAVMSHAKTGAVKLPIGAFRVPAAYAGRRCALRYDPAGEGGAVLVLKDGSEIALEAFKKRPLPPVRPPERERRGRGQLQKLVDVWNGRERPNAQPGFGLPEVFAEIGRLVGRPLPSSEREAEDVAAFYRRRGPLAQDEFVRACARTREALGEGRPLRACLADLDRQIRSSRAKASVRPEETPS